MSNFKVDVNLLEEKITSLSNIKDEIERIDNMEETPVEGSGTSVNILNQIDKEYKVIQDNFIVLLTNTISFFGNVKTSVIEADKQIAEKMES